MGILDFLNTPDAQLGIGLLAAGGPTTDPNQIGFGQRLNGAMNGLTAKQMAQAQLLEMQTKAAVDQYSLQRMKDWQAMLMNGVGKSPDPTSASPAATAQASGVTPPAGGMAAPSAAPGAASPQVSAPAPQQRSSGFPFALPGVGDMQSRAIAMNMNPADYMKMYADKAGPQTDFTKMLAAANIDPQSPLGMQLIQSNIAKQNYTAPVNARPGSILRDPITNQPIAFNPHIPDGWKPEYDAAGNVVSMSQIPNAGKAIASVEQAKTEGKAEGTNTVAFANGQPIFSTGGQDLRRARGQAPNEAPTYTAALSNLPSAQPGMSSSFQGAPEDVLKLISTIKDPQERANALDAYSRQATKPNAAQGGNATVTPQLAPGVNQGAVLSQDELSKKGQGLAQDNASANTVISRLQNIKMLAPGAITGAETGRRDFFNGLLSLAGIKGSEDAKTASDLVDKNASQIVSALRMGQGGSGTDALQTLLGAANPNRHMTVEAINDAADQLIASQKMNQAKAKILTPHVLGRDPQAYGAKELAFDQAADPRVFQLSGMNDAQAAAFIKKMQPQDAADLLQKRKQLKELGAL